jgi:hypothetical protein
VNTKPLPSYSTTPLNTWGTGRPFVNDLKSALQGLKEVLLYAILPRVARPEPPLDPPYPTAKNTPVDEGTLSQCKEIYDQIEAGRDYLDAKARSTFGVIAFLAPLLVAAFTYLLTHSNGSGLARIFALAFGAAAFILLILGFVSTVRALAVQGRDVLFLESVIDPAIPAIRPYDRTRHAQGLLYCASVNAAFNAHISQCVRSAHVLTALAVIIAIGTAIPSLAVLATQKEAVAKIEVASPITVKIDDAASVNDSIKQIRDELKAINTTVSATAQIQTIDARLEALNAKVNTIIVTHAAQHHKPKQSVQPHNTDSGTSN